MVTALSLKTKARSKKYKKARYAIRNVSMKDLSNIIKDFEKTVNVPYVKRIPKHEPVSSYYHMVWFIAECMLRSCENNHHVHDVHDVYAEEMAPPSNANDTEKEKSREFIMHKRLSENLSMDVSESECNIVNETLSQNNSSDVPTNVITEMKYDEHIEPSVSDKGSSYFNIFECGRNLLDQLDVTYQHAFTSSAAASPVQKVLYQISPAQERYYDIMADHIEKRMSELLTKKNFIRQSPM